MENTNLKNENNQFEEKENCEEAESLRITNKYLRKVIYLI